MSYFLFPSNNFVSKNNAKANANLNTNLYWGTHECCMHTNLSIILCLCRALCLATAAAWAASCSCCIAPFSARSCSTSDSKCAVWAERKRRQPKLKLPPNHEPKIPWTWIGAWPVDHSTNYCCMHLFRQSRCFFPATVRNFTSQFIWKKQISILCMSMGWELVAPTHDGNFRILGALCGNEPQYPSASPKDNLQPPHSVNVSFLPKHMWTGGEWTKDRTKKKQFL